MAEAQKHGSKANSANMRYPELHTDTTLAGYNDDNLLRGSSTTTWHTA